MIHRMWLSWAVSRVQRAETVPSGHSVTVLTLVNGTLPAVHAWAG